MMASEAKYRYAMACMTDPKKANESMQQWADDGWELVSGSVGAGEFHTMFAMYWRKPITSEHEPTSV
jgi:hypothetical protein